MIHTYEIIIDADAFDADDDATLTDAFAAFAADCGCTFANVTIAFASDTHAFGASDVRVTFDATPEDVARYVASNDMDSDNVRLVV